jgi:hypothetical protein
MRWARTSHCPRLSQREYDLVGVQFLYVRRRATHIGSYSYGGTGYPNLHAVTHIGNAVVVSHEWTNNLGRVLINLRSEVCFWG